MVHLAVPDDSTGTAIANRRIGPIAGWRLGPDIDLDIFLRDEYLEPAELRDYTCSALVS